MGNHRRDRSRGRRPRTFVVDERARVPFALVGVLLLVTSSAYAAGLADQGLVGEDRRVERAVERVDADATAALRSAAREAAHDAASEPVTRAPSGSGPASRAVREKSAFEDAFRIRLALAGAEALNAVEREVGGVEANASLPAESADDLVAARERVRVESVANGTATRVTFEGVVTTATRNGRAVVNRTRPRTVTVAVPTVAAHERTERFETRLDRGPVEGPGLGRQLTASLYAMAWARGYGQYAGAPVENVVANRHVELSTNAGIVRVQRDVFGTSDPDARGGVARATARTGVTDLLSPTGVHEASWTDAVLGAPTPTSGGDRRSAASGGDRAASEDAAFRPSADPTSETASVEVGHAADRAATSVHDDLDGIVRRSHRVEATAETETTRIRDGGHVTPARPHSLLDEPWRRVDGSRTERVRVVDGSGLNPGTDGGPVSAGESVSFGDATREVVVERAATATWERRIVERGPNGTVQSVSVDRTVTRDEATDRYRVRVSVTGTYAPRDGAPDRPTATFGGGRDVDGPDLTDTPAAAAAELNVETTGDVDRFARDAVEDGDETRSTVVYGERSDADLDRIATDISSLSERVRDLETEASMTDAAIGESSPYRDLAATVRERRDTLRDAPSRYDGAVDRGRVAARDAYLDAVIEELQAAAEDRKEATDGVLDRVNDAFGGPPVGEVIASREAARDPGSYAVGDGGPGGEVTFAPEGSPGYLPRTAVDGERLEGVDGTTTRPLATRNVNYVTLPYSDVSGGIADRILGTDDTVRLDVAGRSLLAADEALAAADDDDLRADRRALAGRIDGSLRRVDDALAERLADRTDLSREQRQSALERAASGYDSLGDRAVAVGEGEYPDRVASEAARVGSLSRAERIGLAAHLRVETRSAAGRDAVRIPARFVDATTAASREIRRDEVESAIEGRAESAIASVPNDRVPKPVRSVGAGLPVAPVPGYWVATVNAWNVEVRGEYPRFALRADVGTPGRPFEYVRESGEVRIDVDGESVALGSTEPVAFETRTVVVVAVPAGPPGVGDVDGTREETSGGWPCPGPLTASAAATDECAGR
ncbi:D-alanyl-D-alanine carboxypeptidase [Halorubrum sp. DM2]|nr:D-alanyl-D-alanine carboxypeptidase [Halorubrum sp. DM2]